jgi:ABC-type bacteriocin/lantibiotic exporter with double-glycine peptidase domain
MEEYQGRLEAIGDQLRNKISTKFQTSTFLAGFAFTVLGVQISELWQTRIPLLLSVSISLMIVSIALYICAIVKLDELTMPKRFWEENASVENSRPFQHTYLVDADLWELRKRMIFYWTRLTLVATALTAISLLIMILPFTPQELNNQDMPGLLWHTLIYTIIAIVITLIYLFILNLIAERRFNSLLRPCD